MASTSSLRLPTAACGSPSRVQDRLPAHLLMGFYHGPGWAEEDCEAPIVLALLDLIGEKGKCLALMMAMKIERYRAAVPLLEDLTGLTAVGLVDGAADPASSRKVCPRCDTRLAGTDDADGLCAPCREFAGESFPLKLGPPVSVGKPAYLKYR